MKRRIRLSRDKGFADREQHRLWPGGSLAFMRARTHALIQTRACGPFVGRCSATATTTSRSRTTRSYRSLPLSLSPYFIFALTCDTFENRSIHTCRTQSKHSTDFLSSSHSHSTQKRSPFFPSINKPPSLFFSLCLWACVRAHGCVCVCVPACATRRTVI